MQQEKEPNKSFNCEIFHLSKENIEIGFKDIYHVIIEILEKSICFIKINKGKVEIEIIFGNNRIIEYETLLQVIKKDETNFEITEYTINE